MDDARTGLAAESRLHRGPFEGPHRTLPTKGYLGVLLAVGLLAYAIDRGALLVLLLPLDLTQAIALMAVVLQLLAAHFGGHWLRRRFLAVDPLMLGGAEAALAVTAIGLGYLISTVLGWIRANQGGAEAGALFLVLGLLDMTVALVAGYLHCHEGVAAVERASHAHQFARRREAVARYRLHRTVARARSADTRVRRAAALAVQAYDQLLAFGKDLWLRNHSEGTFPRPADEPWVSQLRTVANGEFDETGVTLEELT